MSFSVRVLAVAILSLGVSALVAVTGQDEGAPVASASGSVSAGVASAAEGK